MALNSSIDKEIILTLFKKKGPNLFAPYELLYRIDENNIVGLAIIDTEDSYGKCLYNKKDKPSPIFKERDEFLKEMGR